MSRRPSGIVGLVAATALLAAACGDAADDGGTGALYTDRGKRTIESIVAPQIGLGALDASCDAPDGLGFGDSFDCTALTSDGTEILFLATIDDGAVVSMQSLNVLTTDLVAAMEVAISDELVRTHSLDVDPTAVDCGELPLVYTPGEVLFTDCRILHPQTGRPHGVDVEVRDIATFVLDVVVDDQPL